MIGTPDYVAPEQSRSARTADIRSDIYGLGCTFYYLITGHPPFPGKSLMQKLLDHQGKVAPPVELLRPDVPPPVAAVLRRMMAKNPADRYQTPAAVAVALTPSASFPGPP
jgi:serine/threonine protein kinase